MFSEHEFIPLIIYYVILLYIYNITSILINPKMEHTPVQ